MKMENNSATTYTPAKNSTGCREPIGVKVLAFIHTGFWFKKRVLATSLLPPF